MAATLPTSAVAEEKVDADACSPPSDSSSKTPFGLSQQVRKKWKKGSAKTTTEILETKQDAADVDRDPCTLPSVYAIHLIFDEGDPSYACAYIKNGTLVYKNGIPGHSKEFMEHKGAINTLQFSPDGGYLAAVSDNRTVCIWDLHNDFKLIRLSHPGPVEAVAFSSDGKKVLSATAKHLFLWDMDPKEPKKSTPKTKSQPKKKGKKSKKKSKKKGIEPEKSRTVSFVRKIPLRHPGITSMVYTSSDEVAIATKEQSLQLYGLTVKKVLKSIKYKKSIKSLTYCPRKKLLATLSGEQTIKLWYCEQMSKDLLQLMIFDYLQPISGITFSLRAKLYASKHGDGGVYLLEVLGSMWRETQEHETGKSSRAKEVPATLPPSSAGALLASFDHGRADELKKLGYNHAIYLKEKGKLGKEVIARVDEGNTILVEDCGFSRIFYLRGHTDLVTSLQFSKDGKLLLSASKDKTLRLWDLVAHREIGNIAHEAPLRCATLSDDSKRVAVMTDDCLKIWDIESMLQGYIKHSPKSKKDRKSKRGRGKRKRDARPNLCKEIPQQQRHVSAMRFSPDGKHLMVGSEGAVIYIWDIEQGKVSTIFQTGAPVISLACSPDRARLVALTGDKTVQIWNLSDGTKRECQTPSQATSFQCYDRRFLAGAYHGEKVVVFEVKDPQEAWLPSSHKRAKVAMPATKSRSTAFNLAAARALIAKGGGVHAMYIETKDQQKTARIDPQEPTTIVLEEIEHGAKKRAITLTGHTDAITKLRFSRDGEWLLSTSRDKTLRIWNTATGDEVGKVIHPTELLCGNFSRDSQQVATVSSNSIIRIWDISSLLTDKSTEATSPQLRQVIKAMPVPTLGIALSPEGKHLATASQDGQVRIWEIENSMVINTFNLVTPIIDIDYSSLGEQCIIALTEQQSTCLWNIDSGKVAWDSTEAPVSSIHFCEEYQKFYATASDGNNILLLEIDRETPPATSQKGDESEVKEETSPLSFSVKIPEITMSMSLGAVDDLTFNPDNPLVIKAHKDIIHSLGFSPDGKELTTGSRDHRVITWDIATQKPVVTYSHKDIVYAVRYSKHGKYLLSASEDATTRFWELPARRCRKMCGAEGEATFTGDFSADEQLIANADTRGLLSIWHIAEKRKVAYYEHNDYIFTLRFIPFTSQIAFAGSDGVVYLWDYTQKDPPLQLKGHREEVYAIDVSPDGKHVVSAGSDATVRIWDITTQQELHCLKGHEGEVLCVTYSSDGRYIASGGSDKKVILWDVATASMRQVLPIHLDRIWSIAFFPSGHRLVAGGSDGKLVIWDKMKETASETIEQKDVSSLL